MTAESDRTHELAHLYRRYAGLVLRRCELILRNRAAAQDALQETYLRLLKSGLDPRSLEQPLGWLYRSAENVCFDALRRRKVAAIPTGALDDAVGPHPMVRIEERDAALALLADLDGKEQRICVMAFLDGMTQNEIAEQVGLSRVWVNKKVQQIKERAEQLLARRAKPVEASA